MRRLKSKLSRQIIAAALSTAMILSNMTVYAAETDMAGNEIIQEKTAQNAPISITESAGWHESAYLKWTPYAGADSYNVYYKAAGTDNYTKIDDQLIREYPDYYTADALGLASGDYVLKVVAVSDGKEIEGSEAETATLSVDNYVREGFAFSPNSPYEYTTGAYEKDGTLKANADVLYVTNANKDKLTVNGDESLGVGLTEILHNREKARSEKPMAIRILGKVEMPKDTKDYMILVQRTKNVTIEGVGDDAVIHGCGFCMKESCNIEVRNLAIMWYGGGGDGDSLSFDTENKNIWIHNIDFFYGYGGEGDQAKGDGSIDLKSRSDYFTISYNHFWDSGKALVLGGPYEAKNWANDDAKIFVTYHHNWFDHSDSRHPRCVAGSGHVYNNYYDGVAKYGVGAAMNASVFVENNYFRNCPRPMIIGSQGSDVWNSKEGKYATKGTLSGQEGGMIKEYGNVIIGAERFYTYQTTPDEGHFDAYTAESRDEKVPDEVKPLKMVENGNTCYNNFDTDESIMYKYAVETAEQAKETVMKEAGRRNGGDFKYTFDNSEQDKNSDIIPELQAAVINYESKLISVQGMTQSSDNGEEDESASDSSKPSDASSPSDASGSSEASNPSDSGGTGNTGVTIADWNADMEIPGWLDLTGCNQGNTSSSHTVFRDDDSSIASQKKRYVVPTNSVITINLNSASVVKVYFAVNNNGDNKGTATAELDGVNVGTYAMPGRQTSAAKPFEIKTQKGGTLKITNSYEGLLYKIIIEGESEDPSESESASDPVEKDQYDVTLKVKNNAGMAANLTVGGHTFEVAANGTKEETVKLEAGTYPVTVAGTKLKANPASISVNAEQTIDITIEEISESVIVSDKDGAYIGGYETISAALEDASTVNGSVISVKPGYYRETFDVSKSVTLKKAEDCEGEVVIYSPGGPYGGSMDGIVRVSASNVTFKDLTLLNNTQSAYKDIQADSTAENTAAALVAEGDNSVFDNCTFISVQDTLVTKGYSKDKPLLKQTYNNCTFYGATDFVCGSCDVAFNNCEFRFFTGSLNKKIDAYIFAPDTDAKWVVNGGRIVKDDNCIAQNLFYARPWESHSAVSQTLDIFGIQNGVKMTTVKGLMGFGSATGGGKPHHNIYEFKFNVYEGADKNSPLIATTDILGVDIFEINNETPVIEFKNNSSASLIVGNFGQDLSEEFIQNVLADVVEIGFVSEKNANTDSISDTNTVKITEVYKKLTPDGNSAYSLSASLEAKKGFLGAAVLTGVDGEKTVKLVPYVKYDPTTDSSKDGDGTDENGATVKIDKKHIYKFGKPFAVTLKGNGGEGTNTIPSEGFKANEGDGIFGENLPNGVGVNICSNVITSDDEAVAMPVATYKNVKVTDNALKVDKDSTDKLILSTTTSGAVIKYQLGEENEQVTENGEVVIPTAEEKTFILKAWAEKDGKVSETLTITISVKDPSSSGEDVSGEGLAIIGLEESYPYTGAKIIPNIGVVDYDVDGGKILAPGVDYTVKYKNNTKVTTAGKEAEITVTGKGNYAGKDISKKFKIVEANTVTADLVDLKGAKLDKINPVDYTGKAVYPEFKLTLKAGPTAGTAVEYTYNESSGVYETKTGGEQIKANVTLSNNINKGTATILITGAKGKNNKPTSIKKTFKINPIDLADPKNKVTVEAEAGVYSVKGAAPASITVKCDGETLINGTDYAVKYSNNKNATNGKTAKITITGKGNYAKKITTATYAINKLDLSTVEVSAVNAVEGMKAGKVKATVLDANGNILKPSQYTVEVYKDGAKQDAGAALAKGTISVKVVAKDTANLDGETTAAEFNVADKTKDISKAKFVFPKVNGKAFSKTYTGEAVELTSTDMTVTIKGAAKNLAMGDDFEIVAYSNNVNKGTATAVVKGIGDYCGTKTIKFKIVGKDMKLQNEGASWDDVSGFIKNLMGVL